MKPLIPIFDDQFPQSASFGTGDLGIGPTYFNWYRGPEKIGNVCFVTESWFNRVDQIPYEHKVGIILEPPSINNVPYVWALDSNNRSKFDFILTHQNSYINQHDYPGCLYYPFGGCWILPQDRKLHNKTKNVSIIASWKTDTQGHKLRHEIINRFGNEIDVFGNGYKKVDNKIEALRDYKYTIVVENEKSDGWYTEKLIDALVTGTIPIYWGDPCIADVFESVLSFDTIDHLGFLLGNIKVENQLPSNNILTLDLNIYLDSISAESFIIPEDWIFKNFILPTSLLEKFKFHFQ